MPKPSSMRWFSTAVALVWAASPALAGPQTIGQPLTAAQTVRYVAIPPDGAGLPPGHGNVSEGAVVFARSCAACHGDKLQGIASTGAPPLIGGRGTLTAAKPLKTVESYWPYATTVFDYVKRAMPFNAPGSLSNDDVYAVTAYILAQGHIVDATAVMTSDTLPKVRMPNAGGFIPDPRNK